MSTQLSNKMISYSKVLVVLSLVLAILLMSFRQNYRVSQTSADTIAIRGVAGDLWADKQFGKRSFGEISPRKIVPDKVFSPGGVVVDRSVSPGRAYVWDSGNSRILGINLQECYAKGAGDRCDPEIIIGQPSGEDHGACNQDASFQTVPQRHPASASTICGIPEWTRTTLEEKTFTSMYVNSAGDLFVADIYNNRVLRFNSPFTTDTIADDVWGQADFTGNLCNRGGVWDGSRFTYINPTANSLCLASTEGVGGGVTIDGDGNLWVVESSNSRILRFPNVSGTISKTADIVLGKANFTTGGKGSQLNRLSEPSSIDFDSLGNLYVSDNGNNRILRFSPPFATNMLADSFLGSGDFDGGNIQSVQLNPAKDRVLAYIVDGFNSKFRIFNLTGTLVVNQFTNSNPGGGSVGFDTNGSIIVADYVADNNVWRYDYNIGLNTFTRNFSFFLPPFGYNISSTDRMEQGGWGGLGILSNGQMIATDGRLMFWDNPLTSADGAAPTGFVGSTTPPGIDSAYNIIAVDSQDRVYAQNSYDEVEVYQGPLTTSSTPITTLHPPFDVLGGGQIIGTGMNIVGLAPTPDSEYLWVSDSDRNRVFRIREPLTNPVVDIIIGQQNLAGTSCNQGLIPPPNVDGNQVAGRNMLCRPGTLRFDNFGNLYISDHFFESEGNWRLLMFSGDLFPDNLTEPLYNIFATKEFPRQNTFGNISYSHATFEVAFNSANRMVTGFNPYLGPRTVRFYNNPHLFNVSNPADPSFATPAGQVNDFYGWAFAMSFDSNDNLYVFDTNRGKISIYFQPLGPVSPPTLSQVTPVPSQTEDNTPNYTFNSTNSGTITYGGSCSSSTTSALVGNNTITLNQLSDGTYSNCTISVTDQFGYTSNVLAINSFTIIQRSAMLRRKGDFNQNGVVDLSDLSILASYWNQSNSVADANDDNFTNISDLSILAFNWLQSF